MPIHCPVTVARIDAEAFNRIDYVVMGCAYASQNQLGRQCDECAYETDLSARLRAEGFASVPNQVPVKITHQDFSKTYKIDLIAYDAIYELKVVDLVGEHEAQLLNYVLLLDSNRGKLLNFRSPNVQDKIVATPLGMQRRQAWCASRDRWIDVTSNCGLLRNNLCSLLDDWGAFLDIALYAEALLHFLGGAERIAQQVELSRNGLGLGRQRLFIHAPKAAFRLTALTNHQNDFESQLRRLLSLTDLKTIQWINLNHQKVEFITIHADSRPSKHSVDYSSESKVKGIDVKGMKT